MITKKSITLALILILTFTMTLMFIFSPQPASAISTVVINEVHYNPSTGNQNDEFLELYNPSLDSIDIGNWSFSQGITLTFPAATTIPGHGYLVVSPSISQTLLTYGVTSIAQYAPSNLSNSGETVTLIDQNGTTIDSISYSDKAPWPTSPDGSGPSLELKSPALDNSLAASWGGSLTNGGTPGSVNSTAGSGGPSISNVTEPHSISSGQDVTISAQVVGALAEHATLTYKLNFDAEITVNMNDNGVNGDQTNGDGIYSATIPGVSERTLVRYKVSADNGLNTSSVPSSDDSRNYLGYYVKPDGLTSTVPVLDYFMDDLSYTDMVTNHTHDDMYFEVVVVYDDIVYDNTKVRVKGLQSRNDPKKSLKFKLPSGFKIRVDGSTREMNEFHVDGEQYSETHGEVPTAWWVAEKTGLPQLDALNIQLQKNGYFFGSYIYIDKFGSEWIKDNKMQNDDLFEEYYALRSGPGDTAKRDQLFSLLNADRHDSEHLAALYDYIDIPAVLNYMTFDALMSCSDHFDNFNSILRRSSKTDRWSLLHWDMDSCFSNTLNNTRMSPFEYYSQDIGQGRFLTAAVYNNPELRSLFMRRLRTLTDQLYANDAIANHFNEVSSNTTSIMSEDQSSWPATRRGRDKIADSIDWQKKMLNSYYSASGLLPPAQTLSDEHRVKIDQVTAGSSSSDRFIVIRNESTVAVDLTGWSLSGVDVGIPAGSVIPAGGTILIVEDDIGYRGDHDPAIIVNQLNSELQMSGTIELKNNTGDIIDAKSY